MTTPAPLPDALIENYPSGEMLLRAVTIDELLAREFPPREWLLEPAIPTQGLVMLYGPRGMGKTLVAIGIAYALASGNKFLTFEAPKARKVLYVDGEMPAVSMQERFALFAASSGMNLPFPNIYDLSRRIFRTPAYPISRLKKGNAR